jgi:hypothetical protein
MCMYILLNMFCNALMVIILSLSARLLCQRRPGRGQREP